MRLTSGIIEERFSLRNVVLLIAPDVERTLDCDFGFLVLIGESEHEGEVLLAGGTGWVELGGVGAEVVDEGK